MIVFVKRVLFACTLLLPSMLFATPAERILALSPHACEMLYAIGAGDEVVGVSQYCDYPDSFKSKPVIANYSRLFNEPALRLNPSLIIASNAGLKGLQQAEIYGARIIITHPQSIEDIFTDMQRLGRLTGHAPQAEALVETLRNRLQHIKGQVKQRQRVFFEVWSDPLMTEAGRSFITQILSAAGGDNVFADSDMETMRINVEAVVRAAPDVIIIPSRRGDIQARRQFWQQWLPEARLIVINPDLVSRPGPRILDGIVSLQQQLELSNVPRSKAGD
ncbi:MAG: cobalamin-binding protein [Mariprofundus sp.]|nr:cobalamin-binding protein [Mariprofundus sp.]